MIGDWLRETSEEEWQDTRARQSSWRFRPKRKGGKVTLNDIKRELFEYGMSGNIYAIVFSVPDEFPCEDWDEDFVDVWDSTDALREIARWENWTIIDKDGREVK